VVACASLMFVSVASASVIADAKKESGNIQGKLANTFGTEINLDHLTCCA